MEGPLTTHSSSSPLRTISSTTVIEEEYEASASSMAEEGTDDNDDDDDNDEQEKEIPVSPQHYNVIYSKNKLVGNYHRRMSSGNSSSTDSSVSKSPSKLDKKHKFSSFQQQRLGIAFPFQNQLFTPPSRRRFEPEYTPTSGYDGDTEGPLLEDKQY